MAGVAREHGEEVFPGRFITCLLAILIVGSLAVAHRYQDDTIAPPTSRPAPAALGDKPNFRAIPNADARKARFFSYLSPAVARVNAEVRERRERLLAIERAHRQGELSGGDREWLTSMARRHRVEASATDARIAGLKQRVDELPGALVIAQAAIESGWGTSRFAREGNNLFGEWCFEAGCGMVPRNRREGATHEVRWFPSVLHSIRSYFRNLNSHPAYAEVRGRRARARESGRTASAVELAGGLEKYSELGTVYVDHVRTVIQANDLDRVYAAATGGS